MNTLHAAVDVIMHLDRNLAALLMSYHTWIYALLFAVIFAETGLVVTPILPGDSLLFGVGALAAIDDSHTLQVGWAFVLLAAAAILGNSVNYAIGRAIGQRAFDSPIRFLKKDYLNRTRAYFDRHGGITVFLSRFTPIVRTFAPFVAGVGRMPYLRFQAFNIAGGVSWVALFLFSGFVFGNLPWVHSHFGLVTILVVLASMVPLLIVAIRDRRGVAAAAAAAAASDSGRG
ncbi:MAG TPA: VTT domain-containing protein [Steroidobacteraceae bacterium]|jgi:membrane-associated protein|nr:VTT domain-containing protein [Steroidobacteraceae bacterium]